MSKLGINTGNNPNDGQGDPLRVAMGKINSNFTEIYNTLGDGNNVISYVSTAGISTLARNLTNSPIINVSGILNSGITTTEHIEVRNIESTGIITAVQFVGDGSQLTNVTSTSAGISIYDDGVLLGVAREIDFDVNLVSTSPDGTQRVRVSSQASYATTAGIATYATNAGYAAVAGYASTAGIATVARGLTGTPNLNVGVITATSFVGDGSGLTGITATGTGIEIRDDGSIVGTASTINFGDNLSVSPISAGVVTVTASGGGGLATGIVTFTAQALVPQVVDTFAAASYSSAEYTVTLGLGTYRQMQKFMVMHDGGGAGVTTTTYYQEYAIMTSPTQIVSISAAYNAGNIEISVTPESGISGTTTCRFTKNLIAGV